MKNFFITYRRKSGESRITQFHDSVQTSRERLRLEAEISDPDIEIAHISARSLESLKKSHSRYFMGKLELDCKLMDAN